MNVIKSVLPVSLLLSLSSAFSLNAYAEADPKLWPVVKEAFFAQRDIQEVDFLKMKHPAVLKVARKCL